MRNLVLRSTLVAGLLGVATVASAQTHDDLSSNRIVSFGVGGGVSVPVSDAKDAFKNGFNGQGFVRLNLKFLPIAPRLDFTFSKFNLDDTKVGTTGLQIETKPIGPTVTFEPTPGAAQESQISGRAQAAEVIGSALVYPNQASDELLQKVEGCVAKGVSG